jgi:hypothetical protein
MEISENKKETGSDGLICNPSAADLHENGLGIVFRHIGGDIFNRLLYIHIYIFVYIYVCKATRYVASTPIYTTRNF